jgi:hypothetical protein
MRASEPLLPPAGRPPGENDRDLVNDLYRAHALALVRMAKLLVGEFGPGTVARYPRLAPNGAVYFATYRGGNGWQLRAYSLATGTTRLVTDLPGKPLGIVSDTSGRYLLLRYDTGTAQSRHGRGQAVHLGRLDTATGKITSLAAHANGMDQSVGEAVLAW